MVSHGWSRRDFCAAEGVTDLAIGSSDWLGRIGFMYNGLRPYLDSEV